MPPSKGEISDFVQWQVNQCKKLDIPIHFNHEITVDEVKANKPDTLIVATGAEPSCPPIPGVDKAHVVFANDVLAGKVLTGSRCIVIGGGQVGAETAHFLAQQLRSVTILEMGNEIAAEEAIGPKWQLVKSLEARRVAMCTGVKVSEISDEGVITTDNVTYIADTVVLATGSKPVNAIYESLKDEGLELYVIGDAKQVRQVLHATSEGFELGRAI